MILRPGREGSRPLRPRGERRHAGQPGSPLFAFVARREDGRPFVVVTDKDGRATEARVFEAIDEASLAFSPDGRRLAYAGRRDGKWYAVIDGAEGIGYESVGRPAFSGDGSRAGHVGRREGKDVVVLDGKEAAVHDAVHPNSLTFSFDGGRVGYVTGPPRGVAVVVDGAEGLP